MEPVFATIKIIFTNMEAIGWAPWPIVVAAAVSVMIRGIFEPDVLEVNTVEAKREQGRAKLLAFLASYAIAVIASYGFDYPKNDQEQIQILCFSILDGGIGHLAYTAWTIVDPVGRFRDKYGRKGGTNEPPITPAP